MQLYGLDVSKPKDSQRIQVVVAAQRNQTKSFHSRPHAELNAILISRNLCHKPRLGLKIRRPQKAEMYVQPTPILWMA